MTNSAASKRARSASASATRLNLVGLVAVVLWWALAWFDRRRGAALARRIRLGLLATTSLLLAFLAIDHAILDDRLERYGLDGFYAYHRVYLVASAIQWAANLGLVPVTLAIWARRPDEPRTSSSIGTA